MTHRIGDRIEVPAKTSEVRITHDFIPFDKMTRAQQERHLREIHGYDWKEFFDPVGVHYDDHDEYFTGGGLINHVHNKPLPLTDAQIEAAAEALYRADVEEFIKQNGPCMYLDWAGATAASKRHFRAQAVTLHRKRS